ncbi:MAG: hypothetical protein ACE5DW_03605 [Thermodesulfobacteriota bacterium]
MANTENSPLRSGLIKAGLLFIIYAAGLTLRLIPWQNLITADTIYFFEPDNYEHFRKISLILHNFPHPPLHDYYSGFPVGIDTIR